VKIPTQSNQVNQVATTIMSIELMIKDNFILIVKHIERMQGKLKRARERNEIAISLTTFIEELSESYSYYSRNGRDGFNQLKSFDANDIHAMLHIIQIDEKSIVIKNNMMIHLNPNQ